MQLHSFLISLGVEPVVVVDLPPAALVAAPMVVAAVGATASLAVAAGPVVALAQ
jgi:hypothetical protein